MWRFFDDTSLFLLKNSDQKVSIGIEVEFVTHENFFIWNAERLNIIFKNEIFEIKKERNKNQYEIVFFFSDKTADFQQWREILELIAVTNLHFNFDSYVDEVSNAFHLNVSIENYSENHFYSLCDRICDFIFKNFHLVVQNNERMFLSNDVFLPKILGWGYENRMCAIRIRKNHILNNRFFEVRVFSSRGPIFVLLNFILLNLKGEQLVKYEYGPEFGVEANSARTNLGYLAFCIKEQM